MAHGGRRCRPPCVFFCFNLFGAADGDGSRRRAFFARLRERRRETGVQRGSSGESAATFRRYQCVRPGRARFRRKNFSKKINPFFGWIVMRYEPRMDDSPKAVRKRGRKTRFTKYYYIRLKTIAAHRSAPAFADSRFQFAFALFSSAWPAGAPSQAIRGKNGLHNLRKSVVSCIRM